MQVLEISLFIFRKVMNPREVNSKLWLVLCCIDQGRINVAI